MALNTRKAVLPALSSLLKDGGRGAAETLFTILPTLLTNMPAEVRESGRVKERKRERERERERERGNRGYL